MPIDIMGELRQRYSGEPVEEEFDLSAAIAAGAEVTHVEPPLPPKRGYAGELWEGVKATPGTAAQLATGLLAMPVSGYAGMAALPFGEEAAEKTMDWVQRKFTYMPQDETAQKAAELAMWPFEKVHESAGWWGDKVFEATGSPELASTVSSLIEAGVLFGTPVVGKSAVSRVKLSKLRRKLGTARRTGDFSDPELKFAAEEVLAEAKKDPAMTADIQRTLDARFPAVAEGPTMQALERVRSERLRLAPPRPKPTAEEAVKRFEARPEAHIAEPSIVDPLRAENWMERAERRVGGPAEPIVPLPKDLAVREFGPKITERGARPSRKTTASKIKDDTLLTSETMSQIKQRVMNRNIGIKTQLRQILRDYGEPAYQDWMNPLKMRARLNSDLKNKGMPRDLRKAKLNPLLENYTTIYDSILEPKPKLKRKPKLAAKSAPAPDELKGLNLSDEPTLSQYRGQPGPKEAQATKLAEDMGLLYHGWMPDEYVPNGYMFTMKDIGREDTLSFPDFNPKEIIANVREKRAAFEAAAKPPKVPAKAPEITPESQALKYDIEYKGSWEDVEGAVHRYFDPQTNESFNAESPQSVAKDLHIHRRLVEERRVRSAGLTVEDFGKLAVDWWEGRSGYDIETIKKRLQEFLNEKPRTDFGTTADYMEFIDRGEELLGIINRGMRERGVIPEPTGLVKTKLEPQRYQEKYPEKTVHEDWDKANSPRTDFEAAGDILREFQKEFISPGYINEKLNIVGRFIDGHLKKTIHPDDSLGAARKYAPEKLSRLISQYEVQPTKTKAQRTAKNLILSILKGDFGKAKGLHNSITWNAEKWAAEPKAKPSVEWFGEPEAAGARAAERKAAKDLYDGNISEPTSMSKAERINVIREAAERRRLMKRDKLETSLEEGKDISQMLPEEAQTAYRVYRELHEEPLVSSEPRGVADIYKDLTEIFDERGSISFDHLSHEKKMALQRLVADARRMVGDITEYLEAMGLNKDQILMVKRHIDEIRKTEPETFGEPRNVWIDARAIAKGDTIVKQRKVGRGKQAIPLYRSEVKMVQGANELRTKKFGAFENPIRTFEEAGLKDIYYDYRDAEYTFRQEWKTTKEDIKSMRKGVGWKSRKKIGAYAIGQQKRGKQILDRMKVEVPELTEAEMATYSAIRGRYEKLFDRIQVMREMLGKEPLEKVDNYFTFFRSFGIAERAGIKTNPLLDKPDMIARRYASYSSTPFRFGIHRLKKGVLPVELDPFKIYEVYTEAALRHLHTSPIVAKIHELLLRLPDPKTGELTWQMRNKKPNLARFLTDWKDFIAGYPTAWKLPRTYEKPLALLSQNLAYSVLGGNLRSSLIQVSALRNTWAEIGLNHTARGVLATLEDIGGVGRNRKFALENSKILDGRAYDASIQDAMRMVRGGRVGEVYRAMGRTALKPLQWLDMETAIATWNGAHKLATEKGMKGRDAVNFADDVVTRTQASALPGDLAPIQRSVLGKAFTLFQTFVINDWGFLTRDVLGMKNPKISNDVALKKVMRYVIATTLFNILMEDVVGVQSPFPTPIRDLMESLEKDDTPDVTLRKVAFGLVDPIPVIGSARYGKGPGGPVMETAAELVKSLQEAPMAKPLPEVVGRVSGVPGVTQAGKTLRARKRGESLWGQIVGTYTPREKERESGLKGLGGLGGI